jgi:hypothetical protein
LRHEAAAAGDGNQSPHVSAWATLCWFGAVLNDGRSVRHNPPLSASDRNAIEGTD